VLLVVAASAALLAACSRATPQSSLDPAGPIAQRQADLFFLVFWIATGVFVLVEGALVYALIKFRRRSADERPVQTHGNTRLEIAWTIVPALLLAGVAVPTIAGIFELARPVGGDDMRIEVIAHQWWWEVRYPTQDGISEEVLTANELHIPVDTPVTLELTSAEVPGDLPENIPVIHSFRVERLSGAQDVVPGVITTLAIEASEPGTYLGQCAEYCGLSHYDMRIRVIAEDAAGFESWVADQRAEAAALTDEEIQGLGLGTCFACHAIDGVGGPTAEAPASITAPDLTHLASRETIASGALPNTPEALARWLDDPPAVKPGSRMPDYNLTEQQIEDLVAYLMSLR
jgi:cytochrome c oxidase subunit II